MSIETTMVKGEVLTLEEVINELEALHEDFYTERQKGKEPFGYDSYMEVYIHNLKLLSPAHNRATCSMCQYMDIPATEESVTV